MAMSTVISGALKFGQNIVAQTINVVGNKADIVFTRLDNENELSQLKTKVKSALAGIGLVDSDNMRHIILPVVPSELPPIERTFNHETFTTLKGDIVLMGTPQLRRVVLDDYLLPGYPFKYPFCRPYGSAARKVLEFLEQAHKDFVPLRITIAYHDGRTYLDMPCLIENLTHHRDGVDDMRMTISLIEYVELYKTNDKDEPYGTYTRWTRW